MGKLTESEVAQIGKALGDPKRLALYTQIARCGSEVWCGDMCMKHIISDATLSHHLKVLQEHGLITARKEGLNMYYTAVPKRMAAYAAYWAGLAGG